jgi:thioredoxin reductase
MTGDIAVIGGSAAGLSAAVALARFGQPVVVIDDGTPRNAPAGHVHNFLTRDGTAPAEIYRLGRAEAERYGARIETGTVRAVRGRAGAFTLELEDRVMTAGRVIVATGGRDELPGVPGLRERWGQDVLHCPFCHGYEVRNQRIGVLSTGPMAVHQAMMFRLLSPDVTVLAHVAPPDAAQARELAQRGIAVVTGAVTEVLSKEGQLTAVQLADGTQVGLDALVIAPIVHTRTEFLAPLGLQPSDVLAGDQLVATRIETGPHGATAVPGLWVAGNAADPTAQVVSAAAAGLAAASAVIADLISAGPPGAGAAGARTPAG